VPWARYLQSKLTTASATIERVPCMKAGISIASLALLMVLATAAVGAPPVPNADQAQTKLETITIEAQRERAALERRVRKFVSGITKVLFQDSLAQWQTEIPICFAIAGMTRDYGEFVLDRLSKIAESAGAPLARGSCKPNFYVIATKVPDELVAALGKQEPELFGDASGKEINEFATASSPIRVWYNVALYNVDGTPCGFILLGKDSVLMCDGGSSSHIQWGAVRDLSSVVVLIDTGRTKGITFEQLAAYTAMVGLAEIRADTKLGDAPTILRLLSDPAHAPAEGLSTWDTAYLNALYHTNHSDRTQILDMGHWMLKKLAP